MPNTENKINFKILVLAIPLTREINVRATGISLDIKLALAPYLFT